MTSRSIRILDVTIRESSQISLEDACNWMDGWFLEKEGDEPENTFVALLFDARDSSFYKFYSKIASQITNVSKRFYKLLPREGEVVDNYQPAERQVDLSEIYQQLKDEFVTAEYSQLSESKLWAKIMAEFAEMNAAYKESFDSLKKYTTFAVANLEQKTEQATENLNEFTQETIQSLNELTQRVLLLESRPVTVSQPISTISSGADVSTVLNNSSGSSFYNRRVF